MTREPIIPDNITPSGKALEPEPGLGRGRDWAVEPCAEPAVDSLARGRRQDHGGPGGPGGPVASGRGRMHSALLWGLAVSLFLHLTGAAIVLGAAWLNPPEEPLPMVRVLLLGMGNGLPKGPGLGEKAGGSPPMPQLQANAQVSSPAVGVGLSAAAVLPVPVKKLVPKPKKARPKPVPKPVARKAKKKLSKPRPVKVPKTSPVLALAAAVQKAQRFAQPGGSGLAALGRSEYPGGVSGLGGSGGGKGRSQGSGPGLGGGSGGSGGGGLAAPVPISTPKPPYPLRARRRGIEGMVRVSLLVDEKGRVSQIRILDAKPRGYFEDIVRRTLRHWRFHPAASSRGRAPARISTQVRFVLSDIR